MKVQLLLTLEHEKLHQAVFVFLFEKLEIVMQASQLQEKRFSAVFKTAENPSVRKDLQKK